MALRAGVRLRRWGWGPSTGRGRDCRPCSLESGCPRACRCLAHVRPAFWLPACPPQAPRVRRTCSDLASHWHLFLDCTFGLRFHNLEVGVVLNTKIHKLRVMEGPEHLRTCWGVNSLLMLRVPVPGVWGWWRGGVRACASVCTRVLPGPAHGNRAQQSTGSESWLCSACPSICTPGRAGEQPSGHQEVSELVRGLASPPRVGARPLSPGLVPMPVFWAPVLPAGLFVNPQRALPLFHY